MKLALIKTGCFLSKAEILGVGVFSLLSNYRLWPDPITFSPRKLEDKRATTNVQNRLLFFLYPLKEALIVRKVLEEKV